MSKPKRVTKRHLAVLDARLSHVQAVDLLLAGAFAARFYAMRNPVTETATVDYRGKTIPGKCRVVGYNPLAVEAEMTMRHAMEYLETAHA